MGRNLVWIAGIFAVVALSRQTPSFDVSSVKPSAGSGGRGRKGGVNDPTLFSVHNTTLKSLILRCYDIQDYQLSGGPAWMENDRYDIDARPEHPATREQMADAPLTTGRSLPIGDPPRDEDACRVCPHSGQGRP